MSLFSLCTSLGALLISAVGGWGAVVLVLSWARVPDLPADRISSPDGRPAAVLGSSAPSSFTVIRGGTWIGALERVATTGALLFGQPALVAVVVAVKGLGRWSELRDNPGFNERFIIGTLASLIWAGACGLLGRVLLERFIWL